jgi:hypothetical protein
MPKYQITVEMNEYMNFVKDCDNAMDAKDYARDLWESMDWRPDVEVKQVDDETLEGDC